LVELQQRLVTLAEAVADGEPADWDAAVASAADDTERELVGHFRAISAIGQLYSTFTTIETLTSLDSLPSSLTSLTVKPSNLELRSWGSLRLVEKIGRGRFGDVFRAWEPTLQREVALKLLRRRDQAPRADDDLVVEEGRLMARVRHPNVVTIYGAQRIGGRTGLWMELVEGRTLEAELSERGPLPAEDIAAIGIDLSRALAAVHGAGLVHRDVKAQNVLREDTGRTVLGDFGTGREFDDGEATGSSVAGTPAYLAPEIFNRVHASPRTDIYSLGALLFRLATGRYPVQGRTIRELREAHASGDRTPVRVLRPDLPRKLGDAIDRALDPLPSRRFDSAASMETAIGSAAITRGTQTNRAMRLAETVVVAAALAGVLAFRATRPRVPEPTPSRAAAIPGAQPPGGRSLRQISRDPDLSGPGAPSPDGQLISYTDWSTGDLAVQEIATGRKWHLTSNPARNERDWGWAETSRFASDGSGLFFVWYQQRDGHQYGEIRWIAMGGGRSKTIWQAAVDASVYLQHWAGDDRLILAGVEDRTSSALFLISTATGTAKRVLVTGRTLPFGASLSVDAQHIAYDVPDVSSGNRDVHVVSADGQFDMSVVSDPANDHTPVWTRDGRDLLFLSDRSGPTGLWAQHVDGMRPVGAPARIEPNLGWSFFMGLTRDGTYFVRRQMGTRDVYVADIDPATGVVAGPPVRASVNGAGANGTSEWSPDGQQLAFFRRRDDRRRLVIKSLDDGREHEIVNHDVDGVAKPRWESGGQSLLVKATYRNEFGLYRVNLASETFTPVMIGDYFNDYELLPDRHSMIYGTRARREFVRRDLVSGREEVVHRVQAAGNPYGLALTRTGDRLAYVLRRKDAGAFLVVVDLARPQTAREVFHVGPEEALMAYAFTPDERELIVTRSKAVHAPESDDTVLWAIDVETGSAREIGLHVNGLNEVRLSPDGRHVSYDGGWPLQEVWSLENAVTGLN